MNPDAWLKHFNEHFYTGLDGRSANVSVGDTDLVLEIASTHDSRVRGLAERTEIWDDGMIFMYDHDHTASFTRAKMELDVSIWFFDEGGNLVGQGWDEDGVATSEQPYRYVLELKPDAKVSGELILHSLVVSV